MSDLGRANAPPQADPVRVDAEVLENEVCSPVNRRLVLRVDGWPGFVPGQFAMLSPGARSETERWDPLLPRPMAIYRGQAGEPVEILYKLHGRGTALLADALPGQKVRLIGPLGRGFALPAASEREGDARAILVGGGTGVASLYELAVHAAHSGPVGVLLGARTGSDLMGHADFAALEVGLEVATEDGSLGERGLVTALLESQLARGGVSRVYACGPTPMMRACAELAAKFGAPCVVSLENNMACGFGVCLGCAAPLARGGFALVCSAGPVLDASDVAWEALA